MGTFDPTSLEEFYRRHGAGLVLYARQVCNCPEDVVQEAILALLRQDPVPQQPLAWVYTVVRNKALTARRSWLRRKKHEALSSQSAASWFVQDSNADLDGHEVTQALAQLAEEQREIVVARLWGQLTFEEIGQVVGSSAATAFRKYQAALVSLRQALQEPCTKSTSRQN